MLQFALLGLGTGAIYALAGQGLVLVYRGSGVVNFAQGGFAAIGAFTFYAVHTRAGIPLALSLPLALLASAVSGLLMHVLVMRPLRNAPGLTKVIATLGVMIGLQQAGTVAFGTSVRTIPSFLPTESVKVFGTAIGKDRLILLGIAVVASAVLWAVYRYTRFGAVTAAVAENEHSAQFNGHSPDRIAAINWILGGVLGGAAGVLIVPIIGLDVNALILLIIPALATCVVASFDSFPIALGASLVIGIAQSEISKYVDTPGWGDAVPFLLVILVLVVRGQALPLRSHVNELLPEIGTGLLRPSRLILGTAAMCLIILLTSSSWNDALITSMLAAILCVSLVVVTGYGGQLSLAQYAFAGWGGYVATRLAATQGWSFLLVLLIGVAAAIPAGLIVGLPALRTRGIHLAIATFGLAFSLQNVLFQNVSWTGGLQGTVIAPPTLFGWSVDPVMHPGRFGIVCLAGLLLVAVVAANIRRGRSGRRLVAVRGNERAAASLGISVYGAKLYSFAVSAAIAGLGGVLLAYRSAYVDFSQFNVFNSIAIIINTVILGIGFLFGGMMAGGSAAGGLVPKIIGSFTSSGNIDQYVTLALAVVLVPTLIAYPNGLAAWVAGRWTELVGGRTWLRRGAPAEGAAARPSSAPAQIRQVPQRVLEVRDVSVRFGGVHALNNVSLDVRPGEIVGIMGPNGAGKTTLIDAVTGFNRTHSGTITLDGERLDGTRAHARARVGVGRTFQSLELFDQLTVVENLRTACDPRNSAAYLTDIVRPTAATLTPGARAAIAMFDLLDDLERLPSELPYGRRRQVAIARAIASEPSILLLDEPAAGLHESETDELAALLRRLAEEWGIGILLVEHDVPLLNRVCDRLVVMDFGKVIASGTPSEIRNDPRVVAAYLGEQQPHEAKEVVTDAR